MERQEYFDKMKEVQSPLLFLQSSFAEIMEIRANDLTESLDNCISFANRLKQIDSISAQTRAEFILRQCNNEVSSDYFLTHCEKWAIPIFVEELLTATDFRNGFLWTFRDHTTSWSEDQEARQWFYNSVESKFIRHYELWHCDDGPEEISFKHSGNYKEILWWLVSHKEYYALVSPEFSAQELKDYYENFDASKEEIEKEELLELISENPNLKK